jgi:hypothetical protein
MSNKYENTTEEELGNMASGPSKCAAAVDNGDWRRLEQQCLRGRNNDSMKGEWQRKICLTP